MQLNRHPKAPKFIKPVSLAEAISIHYPMKNIVSRFVQNLLFPPGSSQSDDEGECAPLEQMIHLIWAALELCLYIIHSRISWDNITSSSWALKRIIKHIVHNNGRIV